MYMNLALSLFLYICIHIQQTHIYHMYVYIHQTYILHVCIYTNGHIYIYIYIGIYPPTSSRARAC